MTNAWNKVDNDERIRELAMERAQAFGYMLGMIDTVMLAEEYPTVFNLTEKLSELRKARKAYDLAAAAYLDARLTA